MTVHAKAYLEIEIALSGTFSKGYPERGPSYASGGEPGEPDAMEDIEAVGLSAFRYDPATRYNVPVSLMDGVDAKSPDVRKLLANVAAFLGDEAQDALLAEVGE